RGPAALDPHLIDPGAARVGEHIAARLPELVPGVTNAAPGPFGRDLSADAASFNGLVFFHDAQGRAVVVVDYRESGSGKACEHSVAPETCTASTLPDGSTLEIVEPVAVEPGRRMITVRHLRVNGKSVSFSAYTYDAFVPDPSPLVRADYPLTVAQLTALATDPTITL
ncbi:MAG TPA: hypothetical protein VGD67_24095, partial [Pseudonocardiaceae bacterium]